MKTGPATPAGKAKVAGNALRHGAHSSSTDALLALLAETRRLCKTISKHPNRDAAKVREQSQCGNKEQS